MCKRILIDFGACSHSWDVGGDFHHLEAVVTRADELHTPGWLEILQRAHIVKVQARHEKGRQKGGATGGSSGLCAAHRERREEHLCFGREGGDPLEVGPKLHHTGAGKW